MDDPLVTRAEREGGPLVNGKWPTEQEPEPPLICPRTEKEIDRDYLYTCDFCDKRFCKDCIKLNINNSNLNACCECLEDQRELVRKDVLQILFLRASRTGNPSHLKHLLDVRREYAERKE